MQFSGTLRFFLLLRSIYSPHICTLIYKIYHTFEVATAFIDQSVCTSTKHLMGKTVNRAIRLVTISVKTTSHKYRILTPLILDDTSDCSDKRSRHHVLEVSLKQKHHSCTRNVFLWIF
jgi:hypothetical protein